MTGKLKLARKRAKSAICRNRQQKCRIRKEISPVIKAVRPLLGEGSKDVLLHLATGAPISTCQKMLCGQAPLSLPVLARLLRSKNVEIAGAALRAFVGADAPLGEQADLTKKIRAARQLILELEGKLAAMGGAR
jgi:hypothetical protein